MNNIIKWIEQEVHQISNLSGAVFYSELETLCKGRYYLIGYNPGGKEEVTISSNIDSFKRGILCNQYFRCGWNKDGSFNKLQRSVQQTLKKLPYCVHGEKVFATNIDFVRSSTQATHVKDYSDICWVVHRKLISEVIDPEIILCIGNGNNESSYSYLKNKSDNKVDDSNISIGFGNTSIKFFDDVLCGRKRLIIGIPHLSRFKINEDNLQKIYELCGSFEPPQQM